MNDTSAIMDNWRSYVDQVKSEEIFERHEYVTGILGIQLPLDESGQVQLNEELKEQILREHMLYEGFIDSLVSGAKEASGNIKNLLVSLSKILQDPKALETFLFLIKSKIINRIARKFRIFFNKLKKITGEFGEFVGKVLDMFNEVLNKFESLSSGWIKAIAASTLGLLLTYAYEKVEGMIEDVKNLPLDSISDNVKEQVTDWLQKTFVGMFGQNLLDKISNHITDIKSYLGWIGPAVGGVSFIAQVLKPVTSRVSSSGLTIANNKGDAA
jgi:hypothetical protein